jgi:hypothetical protein
MSWTTATGFLFEKLGVSFPDALLLVLALTGFIFFALDLKRGLIAYFILFSVAFIGLAAINSPDATKALIVVFLSAIGLTLSLFTSYSKTNIQ